MLPPAGHHQPRTPSLPSATSYFPVTFLTNSHSSLLLASMDLYLPLPGCSSLILPSYIPHTNCCSLTLSLWPAPISTNTPASPLSLWPPPISPLNQPLLPQLPLSSSCPPPPPIHSGPNGLLTPRDYGFSLGLALRPGRDMVLMCLCVCLFACLSPPEAWTFRCLSDTLDL